jgi:hypothetical protein
MPVFERKGRNMRAPPEKVPPVSNTATRFQVLLGARRRFGQSGGVVQAIDIASGVELWALAIYVQQYDPTEERDYQEVFIKTMALDETGQHLMLEDERRRRYSLDLDNRQVVQLGPQP